MWTSRNLRLISLWPISLDNIVRPFGVSEQLSDEEILQEKCVLQSKIEFEMSEFCEFSGDMMGKELDTFISSNFLTPNGIFE